MAAKSISHVQGKGSISHNNRKFKCKNVDGSRTVENITFIKQSIKSAYEERFDAAVERYNNKQKRNDRKIADFYFKSAFNSDYKDTVVTASDKRKSFYEDLVQLGNKDDSGCATVDGKNAAECLTEYMQEFSKRNPNFYVFNAVMHVDEATPHLHIDYIPIGHYKRGIDTQNGLAQALSEMGYTGKDAINKWRLAERKVLEDICHKRGIEVEPPKQGRGHSFAVDEYKERQEALKGLSEKEKELQQSVQKYEKMQVTTEEIDDIGKKIPLSKNIAVTPDEFALLKEQAKTFCVNKDIIENIRSKEAHIEEMRLNAQNEWLSAHAERKHWEQERQEGNAKIECEYNKQISINKYCERLENEIKTVENDNIALRCENYALKQEFPKIEESLKAEYGKIIHYEKEKFLQKFQAEKKKATDLINKNIDLTQAITDKDKVITELKETIRGAYESLRNTIQAVRMLKYDKGDYKIVNLSEKQGWLIDSLADYGSHWAKQDGLPDIANEMQKNIGISEGIQEKINERSPKAQTHNRRI